MSSSAPDPGPGGGVGAAGRGAAAAPARTPPAVEPAGAERPAAPRTLSGTGVSPGIAYGRAWSSLGGLEEVSTRSLNDAEVQAELARLDSVARQARVSLVRQRTALASHFTDEQRRVFDMHLQMLQDPVIEADVRERIAKQRMNLEAAVKDVLGVYERLFEVVQSQSLRNRLGDMRDVALRLLRFARRPAAPQPHPELKSAVIVVRELSLSDLTEALEHGVAAIVAEEGSLGSHGAILTRAAGLPAAIGLKGLAAALAPGDMLLVDGESGQVTVNPPAEMVSAVLGRTTEGIVRPLPPAATADGTAVALLAAAASPSEVRAAAALGVREVGLYRTDLPVIQRRGAPRETSLVALYRQALNVADRVVFRLPDLDSACDLRELYPEPEANPALGLRGSRLLLRRPELLSTQLRAILRAAEGRCACFAAPFVNDPGDLQLIRDAVDAVVTELRLVGGGTGEPVKLGAVIEVPSATLLGREIVRASDFVLVGLDNLGQLLLAADRGHRLEDVAGRTAAVHPVLLRAVRKLCQIAEALEKELTVYGESLSGGAALPLFLGAGVRRFALRPTALAPAHARLRGLDQDECARVAEAACHAATVAELQTLLPVEWR